jgi:hypothetical protein
MQNLRKINVYLIFILLNSILKIIFLFQDSKIRLFSDSGTYILAASSWKSWNHLEFFRDRTTFFTFFWAPFIQLSNSPLLIIISHTVLTIISGTLALYVLNKTNRWRIKNFVLLSLIIQSPLYFYYERIMLPEILGMNMSLIFIAIVINLLCCKKKEKSTYLFFVIGMLYALMSVLIKTNFIIMFLSLLTAIFLLIVLKILKLSENSIAFSALVFCLLGGFIGILAGSIISSVATHSAKLDYLKSNSAMTSYNLIFKFGPIVNCNKMYSFEIQSVANKLCTLENPQVRERNFDEIMWSGEIIRDWGQSTQEDYYKFANLYRRLAITLILENPKEAILIVGKDVRTLLNPLKSPRFTSSPYPYDVWLSLNPKISLPQFLQKDSEDLLFKLTIWQNTLKIIMIAIVIIFFCFKFRELNDISRFLMFFWVIYVVFVAILAFPSPRYLVYTDMILFLIIPFMSLQNKNKLKYKFRDYISENEDSDKFTGKNQDL